MKYEHPILAIWHTELLKKLSNHPICGIENVRFVQKRRLHMLEREYQYFETLASQLAIDHPHKFAVIKGEQVIGIYDSMEQALEETARAHELGTFIVQPCEDRSNTVQRFHSRVAFA